MSLKPMPLKSPISGQNGLISNVWVGFFDAIHALLNNSLPWQLPSYTVSTVPTASDYTAHMIYVSNESGGATLAFSDGTNWRRVQDRAIIS